MSQEPSNYKVALDVYTGPLDLLLYLIRHEEVDIYDIPIARVTEQYVRYVEMLQQIDPDAVGNFLVMAATLMEIKSRTLLPTPPGEVSEEDAVDPRADLVRQLLEYRRFKDAAGDLADRADEFSRRFPRAPAAAGGEPAFDLEEAEVWDLLAAFNRLMQQIGRAGYPHQVVYDDTPIAAHATGILERLQREGGSVEFVSLFAGRSRPTCVGMFLALLELIRRRRVRAEQDAPFGQIFVFLIDARPLTAPEVTESFGESERAVVSPAAEPGEEAQALSSEAAESPGEDDAFDDRTETAGDEPGSA